MAFPDASLVVAGTYERTLCGWDLSEDSKLTPIFNHPAHLGPIKAVAISGKFLVSGGSDEEIRIFHSRKRTEIGSLMRHQGPITCLQFYRGSHLISGSDDNSLCVWRTKDWECLSILKGHTGGIVDLDVHHTGKVLLSGARDNTVRLWDLSRGRSLYTRKQPPPPRFMPGGITSVQWIPGGEGYCCALANMINCYGTESEDAYLTITGEKQILCTAWVSEHVVAAGGEDKFVTLWDIRSGKSTGSLPAHTSRVRAIEVDEKTQSLVSCSSDGDIHVHALAKVQTVADKEDVKARITCLAVPVGQGARWRGQAAEEEEEAEDEEKEDAEEEDEDEDEEEDEEEEDEEPARKRQLKAKAERPAPTKAGKKAGKGVVPIAKPKGKAFKGMGASPAGARKQRR